VIAKLTKEEEESLAHAVAAVARQAASLTKG